MHCAVLFFFHLLFQSYLISYHIAQSWYHLLIIDSYIRRCRRTLRRRHRRRHREEIKKKKKNLEWSKPREQLKP